MNDQKLLGYLIELTDFSFPDLPDDHANFRLQVDLRYRKEDDDFATHTVIMPGLASYWECSIRENKSAEENEQRKDQYTRLCVRAKENGAYVNRIAFDENSWDRSFRIRASDLYELRVTVFDVDRKDWFEKVADVLKGALGSLTAVPVIGSPLKPLIEGAATAVGSELVTSDDRILFVGFGERSNDCFSIGPDDNSPEGDSGQDGSSASRDFYRIKFSVTELNRDGNA